jgi:hypothetical protein
VTEAQNVPISESDFLNKLPTFKNQIENVQHGPQGPFMAHIQSERPKTNVGQTLASHPHHCPDP